MAVDLGDVVFVIKIKGLFFRSSGFLGIPYDYLDKPEFREEAEVAGMDLLKAFDSKKKNRPKAADLVPLTVKLKTTANEKRSKEVDKIMAKFTQS